MRFMHKILLGVSILLLLASVSNSQEKVRTLAKSPDYPNQPIEVVSRKVGSKPFIDATTVLGGKDWIKELCFGVKNTSGKTITAFDLNIYIKQEGPMLAGIEFPIYFRTYSKDMGQSFRTPEGDVKLGVLRPGEIVNVKIGDVQFNWADNILKKWGVDDITRATFEIRGVYFEDETRWMFGQQSRPDPNDPGKRIRIPPR